MFFGPILLGRSTPGEAFLPKGLGVQAISAHHGPGPFQAVLGRAVGEAQHGPQAPSGPGHEPLLDQARPGPISGCAEPSRSDAQHDPQAPSGPGRHGCYSTRVVFQSDPRPFYTATFNSPLS